MELFSAIFLLCFAIFRVKPRVFHVLDQHTYALALYLQGTITYFLNSN